MLAMFEPQGPKRLTDVTGDGTFISLYGMSSTQASIAWINEAGNRPVVLRPGFQSKKRLFTLFFNHAGHLVVDILPEKTTTTSRHYTGTALPTLVAAVQEQRPNVGTTRTLLLHGHPAHDNARATI